MQAIPIVALDEGHQGQQHTDHGDAAKDALIAHNLEGLYVQICHEVVLKGDLGGLHTLQTDNSYGRLAHTANRQPVWAACTHCKQTHHIKTHAEEEQEFKQMHTLQIDTSYQHA